MVKLGSTLESSRKDKRLANSDNIYDKRLGKMQEEINQEVSSLSPVDEEDLTRSFDDNGNSVTKFADRLYSPQNFSGKGYKILRKNIKPVSLAVTKIIVSAVPTSDGYISFIINGVESHVDVATSSDTTTDKVADKIVAKLTETMTEYEVSKDASTITLTRKFDGEISTFSSFSAVNTGVSCTITDSTKKELRNILTQDMINQANTIYVIRYDFTFGEDITVPANCVLEFDGGSISGEHTITGSNSGIKAGLVKIFGTDVSFAGTWNIDASYLEWFGSTNSTEDATIFLTSAYSLCNKVCLVKSYNLPNGFTLSNGGSLYSTAGYASVKLGAPINIRTNYTKIHNLSISSDDKDNIEAFVFGENSDSPDCYNIEIVSCIIQTFKTAFVINNWTANLFIEKCVINNTISIIEAKKLSYNNTRFNVCIKDSITIYTDYFAKTLCNINLSCTDCYFGVTANAYYFTSYWANIVDFTRCKFELAREGSISIPAPLFYIQGVNRFNDCSFTSNTATNCYWFGQGSPDVFELNSCKFSDFNSDHKITGLFHYLGLPKKYGTIKIRNLQYGLEVIRRPQDYLTEFVISQEYYGYFDFVDYSGICIYCGDGNYDVSKMNDGEIYKIYENNINGDYLYSIIKNGNHILKLAERQDNFLPHAVYNIDKETISRPIGFNVFNSAADRPSSYLEYSNELISLPSFRNEIKYAPNTCVQGNTYRIILYPNLISGYEAPLFSVKLCKSNTADSDDDIVLNLKAVRSNGEVYTDFTAPNNTVYPYIKLTNTSNVYASGHIIKIEKGFLEADGEISGISRSGTFANVPTPRHKGFAYFATDKGQAGVGAMIYYTGNSTNPWVYADGSAVS